jgi:hypothetical protein
MRRIQRLLSFEADSNLQIWRERGAWIALALAIAIGCFTIFWGEFVDEADNLVNGLFISRGLTLYKDLFTHHFPFPYYWVSIIVTLFGKSIFSVRLSVWAFQIITFVVLIKLSGSPLTLGLTALVWSVLRPLYFGTMVIYPVFSSTSLLAVFVLTFTIIQQKEIVDRKYPIILGVYSLVALSTDPLTIYPIGIALLFLLVFGRRQFAVTVLVIIGGMIGYGIYLLATGTFSDFWRDAVLFNSQIYNKYTFTNPVRIKEMITIVFKGLEITDSHWLNPDPFLPLTLDSVVNGWLFTGFLYRFAIIMLSIFLFLQKKYKLALFLLFFSSATLVIDKWSFRSQPFVLTALFVLSFVISGEWKKGESFIRGKRRFFYNISIGIMMLALTWLLLRAGLFVVENRYQLTYISSFGYYEKATVEFQKMSCNQSGVFLGHFPAGTYNNWFTNMGPVSGYAYLWPWIAEMGQNDVIDFLQDDEVSAIVVIQDVVIWNQYDTKEYLSPLISYLEQNYIKSTALSEILPNLNYSTYISPKLYQVCHQPDSG